MFSTARVLPPSGTVKAFVVEDSAEVDDGFSVVVVVVFLGILGILMSGNFATGLRNGGRRFGFRVVVDVSAAVVLVVVVRGLKLQV